MHAAWIERGVETVPLPLKIVAPDINHAILLTLKNGIERWIDPTNVSSFANGTYADIANRPAVLLLPEGAELRHTPGIDFHGNLVRNHLEVKFNDDHGNQTRGRIQLTGNAAVGLTAAGLNGSKQSIDYQLMGWVTNINNLQSWKVDDYNLKDRIVRDLDFGFSFRERWRPVLTSAGQAYKIAAPTPLGFFRIPVEGRVSRLKLVEPVVWHREHRMSGRGLSLKSSAACEGKSPWSDYSRKLSRDKNEIVLADEISLKASEVSVEDLHSKEFADFQTGLFNCLTETAIIL